jgi:hypothetical protein
MLFVKSLMPLCALAAMISSSGNPAHAWVDDFKITLASRADVDSRRAQLIEFIWGPGGFPTDVSELLPEGPSPIADLENLARVEHLQTTMAGSPVGPVVVSSYHFIPVHSRNRLVVVHYGHTCSVNFNAQGDGLKPTIKALLQDGYGVLASLMPFSEGQCQYKHNMLFGSVQDESNRPWHFFLEPLAKSLNYIARQYPAYRDFSMVGLSGGGWATTLYAAIDPRIRTSFPVSGSIPLYMYSANYQTDAEQSRDDLYSKAGYPDLYVLGSVGRGRRQIQVLNHSDRCCFGARQHDRNLPQASGDFDAAVRRYETRVKSALARLGTGSFRVVIFDIDGHLIPDDVLRNVILRTLNADDER